MKVLFTVDTELSLMMQLRGRSAADNFRSAMAGATPRGEFGVPYQLERLNAHGLKGVFFVEALHTTVLGDDQLKRTVGLILGAGHEVQLHCHVEWLWFHEGALRRPRAKQHIADYTLAEQIELLGMARAALEDAGAPPPIAFRAGNYGANDDTLRALAALGMRYDSSWNGTSRDSRIDLPRTAIRPVERHGVIEVPVSWIIDRGTNARHAQLAAVSTGELSYAVRAAAAQGHPTLVIVSHSFELLNRVRDRAMPLLLRRFERLCALLAERPGGAVTAGFADLDPAELSRPGPEPEPVRSGALRAGLRMAEQAVGTLLYDRRAP